MTGLIINISIPDLDKIKAMEDLPHLEGLLQSAKIESTNLAIYIKALERRVRELRQGQ